MISEQPSKVPAHPRGWIGLELIAAFKFLKAATLIAAGLGFFGLLNAGWADAAQEWLERLALVHTHRLTASLAARALPFLDAMGPRRLVALGLGAFLYAGVFLVEGIGLWKCKRWAEYMTIFVTASLLPVEIIALHRRITIFRGGALLLNVAVIVYLAWQVYITRPVPGRAATPGHAASFAS